MPAPCRVALLNGPATPQFARTGRWQATSRGASLWYPIWLAAAAAALEDASFEVLLLDAPANGMGLEETVERLRAFGPGLCVIDTSTASIPYDLKTAIRLKEALRPAPRICLVGPHASALPDRVLAAEGVDFVALNEYDWSVRDLAGRLGEDPDTDGEGIAGIWGKGPGGIRRNPERPLISPLDQLPFASAAIARHLDIRRYGLDFTLHPYMSILTSRGCPSRCTYCLWPQTLFRRKFRERSLDHVFREVAFVHGLRPRIREIFFDDDTFCVRPERAREFAERYRREGFRLPFSMNARADFTDAAALEALKAAGLRCLVVGFESGNQAILEAVRKDTRLDRMLEFAGRCGRLGIQVHGDFVVGLPGETRDTIRQSVEFARRLGLSTFQISIAQPLPGTDFYRWLSDNHYLLTEDYSEWIDAEGRQKCVISYPDLSARDMEQAVAVAIREFYLSWPFLRQAARQIVRDPRELRRYLLGGRRLLRFFLGGW